MAFGLFKRKILLPEESINQWEQEEIEAVIAHELEHLKWYDHYLRYMLRFVQSIFWWIPLKWITARIERNIESHCDQAVFKYRILPRYLIQALLHTIKSHRKTMMITSSFSGNHSVFFRINALQKLMKKPLRVRNNTLIIRSCCVIIVGIGLLLSKLWVF